jgi:hypothetical protein
VFIAHEKEPPYLVSVVELDADAVALGRALNARAAEMFRDCRESGVWPGYGDEVHQISLPRWSYTQAEEQGIYL